MRRFSFTVLLILLLTLAGCGGRQADTPETPDAEPPAEETQEPEYRFLPTREEREAAEKAAQENGDAEETPGAPDVSAVLNSLTLEQKVGQLFFVRCAESGMAEKVARYHLGGVLLFTRDFKDADGNWLTKEDFVAKLAAMQNAAEKDSAIPLFIGSDEEGGTVTRASRNPNLFPDKSRSPQELYAVNGLNSILLDAAEKSYTLRELGINVNFAPVCDVSTDPGDFIYERSLGRDAAETMAYVAGVVSVMRDSNIGSVLKHFPGYGNNADTHTGVAIDERPISTFRNADFLPFLGGIRAGAPFVLVSHNIVNCMDADYPASLSPAVHEILRDELRFDGVALTDDLAMDAVKAYAEDGSVAVLALLAGNDMIVTTDFETQIPQVLAAVADGTLDRSVIDAACTRVLRAKLALGLLGE